MRAGEVRQDPGADQDAQHRDRGADEPVAEFRQRLVRRSNPTPIRTASSARRRTLRSARCRSGPGPERTPWVPNVAPGAPWEAATGPVCRSGLRGRIARMSSRHRSVSASSVRATSGSPPAPASPISDTTSTCADVDARKVDLLDRGRDPDRRGRPRQLVARGAARPAGSVRARRRRPRPRTPTSCSCACRRRRATTARRPVLHRGRRPARSRPCCSPVPSWSTSRPCRSARPAWSSGRCSAPTSRRVQPRVPPRGHRGAATSCTPTGSSSAATDQAAAERVADAVRRRSTPPCLITDPASAETIKYAANGFLAMKISFVNAVAAMCEAVGADVRRRRRGHRLRPADRPRVPQPGPGLGRQLLPEGLPGAGEDRRGARLQLHDDARRHRRQRRAARADGRTRSHGRRTARDRQRSTTRRDHGRCARPHVQGGHRRPARVARARDHPPNCAGSGARVVAFDPTVTGALSPHQQTRSTGSSSSTTRTPSPPTPT